MGRLQHASSSHASLTNAPMVSHPTLHSTPASPLTTLLHAVAWPDEARTYFSQFGELADCYMPKNFSTGTTKGFGFLSYKTRASAEAVMAQTQHKLAGSVVRP